MRLNLIVKPSFLCIHKSPNQGHLNAALSIQVCCFRLISNSFHKNGWCDPQILLQITLRLTWCNHLPSIGFLKFIFAHAVLEEQIQYRIQQPYSFYLLTITDVSRMEPLSESNEHHFSTTILSENHDFLRVSFFIYDSSLNIMLPIFLSLHWPNDADLLFNISCAQDTNYTSLEDSFAACVNTYKLFKQTWIFYSSKKNELSIIVQRGSFVPHSAA